MKYVSFKIIILCILLPPILYLYTINSLENYYKRYFYDEIQNIYLIEITDILNGLKTLQGSVNSSIENYFKKNKHIKIGVKVEIIITSNNGSIIYPRMYQNEQFNNISIDPVKLAQENFQTLNKGLNLDIDVKIEHYSILALTILIGYILLFMGGLYIYYHSVTTKFRKDVLLKDVELGRLQDLEQEHSSKIQNLAEERKSLLSEYDELQSTFEVQKKKAEKTEDDLFDEIDDLESKLNHNLSQQEYQQDEINTLIEKIQDLKSSQAKTDKLKEKSLEKIEKRFKVLYKNIQFQNRTFRGFSDLTEDMKLKAEEVIHQLNENPDLVTVKRKIFSKKGKNTMFEVIFSYNGRLYFRKTSDNRIEIPVVGTKNTQDKDLNFLSNI